MRKRIIERKFSVGELFLFLFFVGFLLLLFPEWYFFIQSLLGNKQTYTSIGELPLRMGLLAGLTLFSTSYLYLKSKFPEYKSIVTFSYFGWIGIAVSIILPIIMGTILIPTRVHLSIEIAFFVYSCAGGVSLGNFGLGCANLMGLIKIKKNFKYQFLWSVSIMLQLIIVHLLYTYIESWFGIGPAPLVL